MLKLKRAWKPKKGDTLIEIALAIAILGFVVAAVSVTMTSTLSASEFSLEETMARNEIDIQAEALRYIHNAYFAQHGLIDDNKEYDAIWKRIVEQAVPPSDIPPLNNVESCNVFYSPESDDSIYKNNAFLINTHRLSPISTKDPNQTNQIILTSKTPDPEKSIFQPASIYPRMLYGFKSADDTILGDSKDNQTLYSAEGIWISAACSHTNNDGTACAETPEYYDFYIRTCWNSLNKHSTTTIGTIVRLHNPELSSGVTNHEISTFSIDYYDGVNSTSRLHEETQDYYRHYFLIRMPGLGANQVHNVPATSQNLPFSGWCVNYSNSYNSCNNPELTVRHNGTSDSLLSNQVQAYSPHNNSISMVAAYCGTYSITYSAGSGVTGVSGMPGNVSSKKYCRAGNSTSGTYTIPTSTPARTDYKFTGWRDSVTGAVYPAGSAYAFLNFDASGNLNITLTATWVYNFTAKLNFDKNASFTVSNIPSARTCTITNPSISSCNVTIPNTIPTSDENIFTGWYYSDGTLACAAKSSCSITLTAKNNTVYAHWHSAYLQDMDAEFCASSAFDASSSGSGYSNNVILIDKRDNKKYNIYRTNDGDCWMAQNFAYNPSAMYVGTHKDATRTSQGNYYNKSSAANSCSALGSKWRLPSESLSIEYLVYPGMWGYSTGGAPVGIGTYSAFWVSNSNRYVYYDSNPHANNSYGLSVQCYYDV